MATITSSISGAVAGAPRVIWSGVSTADTMTAYTVNGDHAVAGSVQMSGTWGSSTVVLQCSNDGSTWFTMKDVFGNNISATANAFFEFSSAAVYIRPASSGGTADNVEVTLAFRG